MPPPTARPPRRRPSPDMVLGGLVRAALDPYGATVAPRRPDDFLRRLPFVELKTVDRDATRNLQHVTTAEVDVQTWAKDDPSLADDLDDAVLQALLDAKRRGTAAAGGRIGGLEVVRLGTELRTANQPGDVYRWQAAYRALIRPA